MLTKKKHHCLEWSNILFFLTVNNPVHQKNMKNTYEILKAWAKDILKKQSTSLKITFIW